MILPSYKNTDLHVHTNCSDGLLSPIDVIRRAAVNGAEVMSITDHDTVAAYTDEVFQAASSAGVSLIPGVEISTVDEKRRRFHILGYGINLESNELQNELLAVRDSRRIYTENVLKKLKEYGWQIEADFEAISVVTKAHIADAVLRDRANNTLLIKVFEKMPTRGEFIEGMMNKGKPCYVKRQAIQPRKAVEIIHAAGGLAFFAHPVAAIYEQDMTPQELEGCIVRSGVDGMESFYLYYHKSGGDTHVDRVGEMCDIAERHNLLTSVGSDFHGVSDGIGACNDICFAGGQNPFDSFKHDSLHRFLRALPIPIQ